MRSITTVDPRTPVAISMPGRYKSCRRSPSELFTKEQEQELQQCALDGIEDPVKAEQQEEPKEKESPVKSIEVNPAKLTPLRWRSTSMKELSGSHEVAGSAQPTEESTKIPPGSSGRPAEVVRQHQPAKRPSQAQLRAQVMNSLSSEKVNDSTHQVERVVNHAQAGEPGNLPVAGKEGSLSTNSTARTELFPENPAANHEGRTVSPLRPEELVKASPASERSYVASGNGINGVSRKAEKSVSVVPIDVDLPEEIVFQPVDLDQKYREKELVRHVTAAKIQNREEALLNNPGSPALNGRKGIVGEEPAAMTIEFLRARLQAERSASKTVKLKLESLSKKVVDLESRLSAEIELRKSAEAASHDALTKLKQAVPPASTSLKVADSIPKETMKTVQRGDVDSNADFVPPKTVVRGEIPVAANIPPKEKTEPEGTKDAIEDSAATEGEDVVNTGGLWRDRSVSSQPSASTLGVGVKEGEKESSVKVAQDSCAGSSPERTVSPSKQKQEKRVVIEERLRSMWAKIGEDMSALAEVRGDQEPISKDTMGWVAQLPSILQEKQSSGDSGQAANGQQVDSSEGDGEQTETMHTNGNPKQDAAASKKAAAMVEKRNSFKRNASLAKNVAKLVEQYEFQETAQREWEEKFEAQQSQEKNEGEPPALVTPDGDVLTESTSGPSTRGGIARSQSQGERNPNLHGERISRSKSMGFLPSQQGVTGGRSISRKASLNGRIEILDDSPIDDSGGDPEELLFDPETEVAEELPNGIYLHRSREEVDSSYKRSSKDAMYRRSTDRVGAGGIHSPHRAAHHSRERYPRTDSHGGEVDQQGWPVREVQERASRDMYYEPIINNSRGGARGDNTYSNSDREFHHRSKPMPERVADDMHRNGPWREVPVDRLPRPEDVRRGPANHYEEAPGMPYGYHRGMPGGWQDGGDPGLRNRGMSHPPYGYPPTYGVEEHQQPPYVQPGLYADAAGYNNRRDLPYVSHGAHNSRPDYYSYGGGLSGPRPPMNGYVPPDRQPSVSQGGHTSWDSSGGHEDRNAPVVGMPEDAPSTGEAGEVLKALRIAKQQIKNSTGEQAAFMTAQYTVSQEHRYGAGGQVSKTSYTVEAPVGWHLEGGKSSTKRRNGLNGSNGVIDLTGANVTELISGAGPLTVTGGESSYVEKLNVGRGIQFFFSS
ncbi:unnamed protein product [Calypogeia fissa]